MAQSLWRLQAWQVASQAFLGCVLGPRASQVEEAGAEDSQRGQSRGQGGERQGDLAHRYLGSTTSVWSAPGLAGRGLPSREGLSARPCLPSFGSKKSTWSGGAQRGAGRGRGEKKQKNPRSRRSSEANVDGPSAPAAQVALKHSSGEDAQAGLMLGWERHCRLGCGV